MFHTTMKLTSTLLLLATAASMPHAHEIDERSFEGGVLERRADWQKVGCYSSSGSLTLNGTDIYQSSLACEGVAGSHKVIALTNGDTCYYGDALPPSSDKVDDSECSTKCQGYPENCGSSSNFWVLSNGGVSAVAGSSSSPPTTSATSASSQVTSALSVVTSGGGTQTVVVTQPVATPAAATAVVSTTPTSSAGASNGHQNTVGIAVGVVVGVVGAAALAAAIFFFLRSRKQKEQAAELQRQNSIAGLRSEKPPSTYSMPDSRLEPAYMRRMSDGSIADNQDYSRRILKVSHRYET